MSDLTPRDRELVALGAAMGSNCVPCVEYHIPESRRVGLTDAEIHEAIQHADKIRQVPARKTLQAAMRLLPFADNHVRNTATDENRGCAAPTEAVGAGVQTAQPGDLARGMMSKLVAKCGGHGEPASTAVGRPTSTATIEGCGCG